MLISRLLHVEDVAHIHCFSSHGIVWPKVCTKFRQKLLFHHYCNFSSSDPLEFGSKFSSFNDIELGYRLPNNTEPIRYDITITTHIHLDGLPNRYEFDGVVSIQLRATEVTSYIVLHQRQLTILSAQLSVGESAVQSWTEEQIEYDEITEFLTFNLDAPLSTTETYTLRISYKGDLREDEAGYYRSSYVNENGDETWLATTQFEATDARHGFPCYDEPGVRAVYGITLIHGSGLVAIANTPQKSKEENTEYVIALIFLTQSLSA